MCGIFICVSKKKKLNIEKCHRAFSNLIWRGTDHSFYKTILTEKSFNHLLEKLVKKKSFAFDVETTDKRPVWARAVGISFSFEEGSAYYLPLAHRYLGSPDQLELKMVCERLKPIFEDKSIK